MGPLVYVEHVHFQKYNWLSTAKHLFLKMDVLYWIFFLASPFCMLEIYSLHFQRLIKITIALHSCHHVEASLCSSTNIYRGGDALLLLRWKIHSGT